MKHPPAQAVDPTAIDWALLRLKPPTERELAFAQRVGLDPNRLLERFRKQYEAACAADGATIDAITGDDESCGPVYCQLWDYLTEFTDARRVEWWVAPLQNVAKVRNPRASVRDMDAIERMIHSTGHVGHTLTWTPARRTSAATSPPTRQREHRPAPSRRTSSSSRSSGSDPGSDGEGSGDGEHDAAARLGGFLVYLIGFDWPEALIDRAFAFSIEVEREVTR